MANVGWLREWAPEMGVPSSCSWILLRPTLFGPQLKNGATVGEVTFMGKNGLL